MKNETRKRYDLDTDRIYTKKKNEEYTNNAKLLQGKIYASLCFIFISTTDPAPNFRNFYYW